MICKLVQSIFLKDLNEVQCIELIYLLMVGNDIAAFELSTYTVKGF